MNLFELTEFLKEQNPGKTIDFIFPKETHRHYEIMMNEGKPNPNHHVECGSVQINIEGKDPYIQRLTAPHRLTISLEHMQNILKEVL